MAVAVNHCSLDPPRPPLFTPLPKLRSGCSVSNCNKELTMFVWPAPIMPT